jgi:hypothetical protein
MKRLLAILLLCLPLAAVAQPPAQQVINIGTGPNTGNGDNARAWAQKDNANITALFSMFGNSSNLYSHGNALATDIISLFSTCSGVQYLGADGACHTSSSGSVTPGTTTVVGATAPCLLDNSATTVMGCAQLASTISLSSGVIGTTVPRRTVTVSPTVASTDMGGVIYSNITGGGTATIPAISATVFAAGMSATIVNYSASTEAVSTTPTINSGGGCVSGTGIPAGDTWEIVSNGTTLDCNQTVASASGSVTDGAGTVTANLPLLSTTTAHVYAPSTTVTYLIDTGAQYSITGTGACSAITKTGTTGTSIGFFQCTGTTGASTVTITLPTATNGWHCSADDETTTADSLHQTSHSTTSATLSGTVASNDHIAFGPCGGA